MCVFEAKIFILFLLWFTWDNPVNEEIPNSTNLG